MTEDDGPSAPWTVASMAAAEARICAQMVRESSETGIGRSLGWGCGSEVVFVGLTTVPEVTWKEKLDQKAAGEIAQGSCCGGWSKCDYGDAAPCRRGHSWLSHTKTELLNCRENWKKVSHYKFTRFLYPDIFSVLECRS